MRRVLIGLLVAMLAPVTLAAQIESVRLLTADVRRYGLLEIAADVSGDWRNPFDPEQIDLQAEVMTPAEMRVRVPAFWYQGYEVAKPASAPGEQVDLVKLYLNKGEWPAGAEVEVFVDDVALIRADGALQALDDMEAPGTRWGPLTGRSEVLAHGGKASVLFRTTIDGNENWPGAILSVDRKDWTAYQGLVMWVYPRCDRPLGPLQLYCHDVVHGNSVIGTFAPEAGDLKANQWNRLQWRWGRWTARTRLVPAGRPEWRVRYTPTQAGAYTVRLLAVAGAQRAESKVMPFAVGESALPGFVRVSRKDPHYFAFDNGTAFFPIGHDVPWVLDDVLLHYPKMHQAGENATYFILCPWDMSFEWKQLGVYDLERAASLDRVIQSAAENGIYLKLSFDIHNAFHNQWMDNPYNAARGGPCATPADFFSSETAWKHYGNRLRYIAARWGYSPNLMAWEPVAELNGAVDWTYTKRQDRRSEATSKLLGAFLEKASAYLKTVDPNGRLFTTSYGSDNSDDRHWALPCVDYLQIHSYDSLDVAPRLGRWVSELTARYRKPMMVTEFGWRVNGVKDREDPEGICLHNGIWSTALAGSAGAALNWWWDVIDGREYYPQFKSLGEFVAGVDWPAEGFAPMTAQADFAQPRRLIEAAQSVTAQGGFGDVPADQFVFRADGSLDAICPPPAFLLGEAQTFRKIHPTFVTDLAEPAKLAVQVADVAIGGQLEMRLDGKVLRTIELPAENVPGKPSRWDKPNQMWVCNYDQWVEVEIPAGQHQVQFANSQTNASWIQISAYRLTSMRPQALRVLGLRGRRTALLWLQNSQSTWGDWAKPKPEEITGTAITVNGLADGVWEAQWWDTWRGQTISQASCTVSGGRAALAVPPVARDVACRLTRVK